MLDRGRFSCYLGAPTKSGAKTRGGAAKTLVFFSVVLNSLGGGGGGGGEGPARGTQNSGGNILKPQAGGPIIGFFLVLFLNLLLNKAQIWGLPFSSLMKLPTTNNKHPQTTAFSMSKIPILKTKK